MTVTHICRNMRRSDCFLCGAGIDLWQFWFHWSPNDF